MADEITDLLQVRIENAKRALPEDTQNAIAAVDWKDAIIGMRAKRGYTFEQLGDLELETELVLAGLTSPENYSRELSTRMKISSGEAGELVNEMNDLVFRKIREELVKTTERKKLFSKQAAVSNQENEISHAVDSMANISRVGQTLEKLSSNDSKREDRAELKEHGIEIIDVPTPPGDSSRTTSGKEVFLGSTDSIITPGIKDREDILQKIEKSDAVSGANINSDLPVPSKLELVAGEKPAEAGIHPLVSQKFSQSLQMPMVETEYSLNNISKTSSGGKTLEEMKKMVSKSPEMVKTSAVPLVKSDLPPNVKEQIKPAPSDAEKTPKSYALNGDPYRLSPDE